MLHDELRAVSPPVHIVYLTQNMISETLEIEKNEMDQDRILTHSRVNMAFNRA